MTAFLIRRPMVTVSVLAGAFFFQSLLASLNKSPAWDEPFHVASALLYVETGRIVRVTDHTPLLREISGVVMNAAGIRLPATAEAENGKRGIGGVEYSLGADAIHANGQNRVLFWARLPMIFLGTALVFAVYWLGRRLVGEGAGVAAAFLCAFDPILISNSALVYTDVGLALFEVLMLVALWDWIRNPRWTLAVWTGAALGATLASKYSSGILLPVMVLLVLLAQIWPPGGKAPAQPGWWPAAGLAAMFAVAFVVIQFVYLFPNDPFEYAKGMFTLKTGFSPDYPYYMAGEYSLNFWSYYLVAWALKEPLATVLVVLTGLVWMVRGGRLALAFVAVPSVALVAGYSAWAGDLGVRYMVPVLPLAFVAGGAGLVWLLQRWRVAGAVLCVWLVMAAAGIFPDHMSYFNEAACLLNNPAKLGIDGGSRCGPEWLDDTNVDAGLAVRQLRGWLERNQGGRPVYFGYFGSYLPDWYGIPLGEQSYADLLAGVKPGLYVASGHILARAHHGVGYAGGDWMLLAQPIAVIGHSYYVFEKR